MNQPVWVSEKLVTTVHEMLLAEHGGLSGIRDAGLLQSALKGSLIKSTVFDK